MAITDDRYRDHVLTEVHLLHAGGDVLLDSRAVNYDETVATLRTEGTIATYETDSVERVQFVIDQSVFQLAIESAALPTGSATGVAQRAWYGGTYLTAFYGLKLIFNAVDLDTGVLVVYQVVVPKCQVRRYNPMQGGATRKAIAPQQLILSALLTTTDHNGGALAGGNLPPLGVFFYRDKMA